MIPREFIDKARSGRRETDNLHVLIALEVMAGRSGVVRDNERLLEFFLGWQSDPDLPPDDREVA